MSVILNEEDLFLCQRGLMTGDMMHRIETTPITIVGAGAGGSELMLSLPKIGCKNITVIDFDVIDAKNYNNQLYGKRHIGRKKVDALRELVEFLDLEGDFKFIDAKVDEFYPVANPTLDDQIIVSGVDTMAARKIIFDQVRGLRKGLLTDTRIGKEFAVGIAINLENNSHKLGYDKHFLFTDAEAAPDSCTEKTYKGVADWIRQFIVNSIWCYHLNGLSTRTTQVVNCYCDTQKTATIKL